MKKVYEGAVVEAFLKWKGLPPTALEDSDRERPDALIKVGERSVGVEVTTLTEAKPRQEIAPQKWTTEAKRIVETARIAFESANARPFVVRFQFRPDWRPPDRRGARLLAAELARVVQTAGGNVNPDSDKIRGRIRGRCNFIGLLTTDQFMPRGARLDAPGVLQHVMARGIERRKIFRDSHNRGDLLVRTARGVTRRVKSWFLLLRS